MSVVISCPSTAAPPRGLLADEDVLADLWAWHHHGLRAALVTLVGIEGAAPRPLGAQMAIAEDGRYVGYLSGGCLEQAIVLEAQDVIRSGSNRLVRYGKGSPYFDIRLPCGSGLDMYFDCSLSPELMGVMAVQRAARKGFVLKSTLSGLPSEICTLRKGDSHVSARDGDTFARVFLPDRESRDGDHNQQERGQRRHRVEGDRGAFAEIAVVDESLNRLLEHPPDQHGSAIPRI